MSKGEVQDVTEDLKNISRMLQDIINKFVRTQTYFRFLTGTIGDVTVGVSTRFPDSGQTAGLRKFLRAGKILRVRVMNTGAVNPLYVAFNHDATTDEPLIVWPDTFEEFDVELVDFLSLCSTSVSVTTTARVAFYGE